MWRGNVDAAISEVVWAAASFDAGRSKLGASLRQRLSSSTILDGKWFDEGDGHGAWAAFAGFHAKLDQITGAGQALALHGAAVDIEFGLTGAYDKAVMLAAVEPFDQATLAPGGGHQLATAGAVQRFGCARQLLLLNRPQKRNATARTIPCLVMSICLCHLAAFLCLAINLTFRRGLDTL